MEELWGNCIPRRGGGIYTVTIFLCFALSFHKCAIITTLVHMFHTLYIPIHMHGYVTYYTLYTVYTCIYLPTFRVVVHIRPMQYMYIY